MVSPIEMFRLRLVYDSFLFMFSEPLEAFSCFRNILIGLNVPARGRERGLGCRGDLFPYLSDVTYTITSLDARTPTPDTWPGVESDLTRLSIMGGFFFKSFAELLLRENIKVSAWDFPIKLMFSWGARG